MKNIKKTLALILVFVMIVGLVACGKTDTKPTEPKDESSTLSTDNTTITEPDDTTAPSDDDTNDEPLLTDTEYRLLALFNAQPVEFPVMTWALEINNAEAIKSYAGLDDMTKVSEVAVTEPAMSTQAYSVVLVKVADGVDAANVADEMKNGVNPSKWVGFEADEIETVVVDDYVLLVMMASDLSETVSAKSLTEAYVELMKSYEEPEEVAPAPTISEVVDSDDVEVDDPEDADETVVTDDAEG